MIKQWFLKLLSPPTVKNNPLPVNVVGDRAVVQMFPSFSNLIKEAYTKNSIVLACITRLALDFPEPKIIIRSKIDNAIISNHPIHTLLNKPNPLMSLYELMAYIMTYLAIGGNAYIHLRRNRAGKIIELWPYHAGDIKPVLSQSGQSWLSHYEHTSSGRITIVPIEDIVHFKWVLPDLQQPVVAQPPLLAVASEVDSSNFLTLYLLKLLQNDATPRTVLTVPEGTLITDKSRSRLLDSFVQSYSGENIGKPLVLERGVDVKRIALSLEELAVESLHYLTETAIAGAFQIPPIMAGLGVGLARGTFSNYETAERAYTMHTLIPLWRMRDGELNSSFVSVIDDSVYLETDFSSIAALSENNDALWARAASGFSNQLLTLNEARSLIGYPPLEDEQNDPNDLNDQISSPPKQLQRSQLFKSKKYVDPEYIKTTIVDGIEGKLLEPSWLINKEAEHDTYRQLQFDMNMRTQGYLEAQYAKAAELIATNPTISILELEEHLDLRGEELKALIEPIFRELFVVAFDDVSDLLAVAGLSYEVYQPELEEVIDELGNLVTRVSDTTVQDIRNIISDQVLNGRTIDETVAALMKLSEITSVHRAKMIAVNESNRAYSSASVLAYKKSGVVKAKQWRSKIDDQTSDVCRKLNRTRVPLDDPFDFNGQKIDHPPGHPGICRSAILPVIRRKNDTDENTVQVE